jgi:nitronate monooxygenase
MTPISKGRNVLKSKLCQLLNIQYPIIGAGMGWVSGPEYVAAVSNSGGLGLLGAIGLTAEETRIAIKRIRELTDKPIGIDCAAAVVDEFEELNAQGKVKEKFTREQIEFVKKLAAEWGVSLEGRELRPWAIKKSIEEQAQVIMEEKVPVYASAVGNPSWLVPRLHAGGVKVMALVGNVKQAKAVARGGVDIVIAQGNEAGGHTGPVGTMVLIPQVVDAVYPTPVVAAGGIGDSRGLVAALALGAVGVLCGTLFLTSDEILKWPFVFEDHPLGFSKAQLAKYMEALIAASDSDTYMTRCVTGFPGRCLKNRIADAWKRPDAPPVAPPLFQWHLMGELLVGARKAGLPDAGYFLAGQVSGLIREKKNIKQIIPEMVQGAIKILEGLSPK